MDNKQLPAITEEDRQFAEKQLESARLLAASHLPTLVNLMVERALDPMANQKTVVDAAEYAYRVSGMANKQEKKEATTGFSIQIVLPGQNKEVIIGESSAVDDRTETETILDEIPSYVSDLVVNLQHLEAT